MTSTAAMTFVASTVAILIVAASGCGGSNDSPATTGERAAQSPKPRVPRSLGRLESSAEDIIDFARQGMRPKMVAAAHELRRTARGKAAVDLRAAAVPESRVALLNERARLVDAIAQRGEALRVSLAANQVSALMPELYARYADPVPPEVLKLDYLDREAELRSRAGDAPAVRRAAEELSSTWSGLRPRVVRLGASGVVARYTRHVAAMRRLVRRASGAALRRQAGIGLALVDRLEGAFRRR